MSDQIALEGVLAALLRNPDAVTVIDSEGRVVGCNPAFRALFEMELPPGYLILEDALLERGGVIPAIRAALQGESQRLTRIAFAGPASFDLELTMAPIGGDGALVKGAIVFARQRDRPLKFEPHRTVFERSTLAVLIARPDGTILAANPEACRLLCRTEAELRTGGRQSILDPTDPRGLMAVEQRQSTGEFRGFVRFLRGDRSPIEIEIATSQYFDSEGREIVSTCFRDVSAEREAELALDQTRERYETLVRTTRDTLWEYDLLNKTITWSDRIDAFGYDPQDVDTNERWWMERIHPDDRERIVTGFGQVIRTGGTWSDEYRFRRQDGTWAHVIDRGTVLLDAAGVATRALGLMIDITPIKEMQHKLAMADRLVSLGTLAAGVAHEINNPLAFLLSNLNYAAEELLLENRSRADLDEVSLALNEARIGAERVRAIVRDLKVMSRTDDGTSNELPLETVLDSALLMLASGTRHRARIVKQFDAIPPVLGNEGRLSQLFLNLLVNAAQAIPEDRPGGGEIRVTTQPVADAKVVVEISDNGCGISPENLTRIFDPFFTTKPVGVGTGLGLYICHELADAMGAEIDVKSEVGQGTTFRVTLPTAARVPAIAPTAAAL